MRRIVLTAVAFLASIPCAQAALIDFEGFAPLTPLGPVTASDGNTVTFSVGPTGSSAFVADVGGTVTAFVPFDTPAPPVAGLRFLTDEIAGPSAALDYFMTFSIPVTHLSLDLYDYRVDGGPSPGDTATLGVFSDSAFSVPVGSSTFTIPTPNPSDGNVVTLSVLTPLGPIRSASVVFNKPDVGTGIDNISFASVPEPVSCAVWASLIGLAVAFVRRRR